MSLRDEFEKLFPPNESDAERQDALWLGFQAGHDCWEGYWVTWERWPAKFGAERKDFEPLPPPPNAVTGRSDT